MDSRTIDTHSPCSLFTSNAALAGLFHLVHYSSLRWAKIEGGIKYTRGRPVVTGPKQSFFDAQQKSQGQGKKILTRSEELHQPITFYEWL